MQWRRIDLRRGVVGAVGVVLAVGVVGLLGAAGLLAALCALFLAALDEPDETRDRLVARARFVAVGAAMVALLSWSGDETWSATLVASVVIYVATLASAWGPRPAAEGQFLVLLTVITLMIGSTDLGPLELSVAYAIGGLISTAVMLAAAHWLGDSSTGPPPSAAAVASGDRGETGLDVPALRAAARSPTGVFAFVRALAVGVATAAGYELFESHPVWAMLTVVLVLQPPARQTVSVGLRRTAGTVLGMAVGIVIIQWFDESEVAISVAFVLAAFATLALEDVSYVLSTTSTTCVLLLSQRILEEDAVEAGWQRVGATLLGTLIALAVVFTAVARLPRNELPTSS